MHVWAGLLVLGENIIPGAMTGTNSIIGKLSNALGNLATCKLSIVASKPYFENITEHSYQQLVCNTAIDSQVDFI